MKVLKLVPPYSKQGLVEDSKRKLESAIKEDFETVIIHGFKDGIIYTSVSGRKDALTILGALEVAKDAIWQR